MNLKDRMILEDFRGSRDVYVKIGDIVHEKLAEITADAGIEIMAIEHRIKTENSLAGKLEKRGEKFLTIDDVTDLLGARVICYFNDDVDKIGELVEQTFTIDYARSKDKRALLKADTFGYQSLHYICSLLPSEEYPEAYTQKKFEIQIRTNLQHTWAQIEHDLGYKTEFGVPRNIIRSFACIASLLELADHEFIRVRDAVVDYTQEIRDRITNDEADDLPVNSITLQEYITQNKPMKAFLDDLAGRVQAELYLVSSEAYVDQLKLLGVENLGQLSAMRARNYDLAMAMAETVLQSAELDMVSSNVALRYLCRAELISGDYSEEDIQRFLTLALGSEERATRQAKQLLGMVESGKIKTLEGIRHDH